MISDVEVQVNLLTKWTATVIGFLFFTVAENHGQQRGIEHFVDFQYFQYYETASHYSSGMTLTCGILPLYCLELVEVTLVIPDTDKVDCNSKCVSVFYCCRKPQLVILQRVAPCWTLKTSLGTLMLKTSSRMQ